MINNYMLYENLPSIDLHGTDRITVKILVEEFINDNIKLHNKLCLIVHGKGTYVLRNAVHELLKLNKNVKAYKSDIFNDSVTVVELK